MIGVLRNLKSEVWEWWCEGCEGFLFKIPGKARVRARVSIGLGKTLSRGRKGLEEWIEFVMSDKRDLSIYFAKYILQNYGCSKFFRHFFAVFSHLGEISTPICVEGIS